MDVGGVAADVVVKEGVELTGEALKLAGFFTLKSSLNI